MPMTKLQRQGHSITVTIPAQIARIKGSQKGTEVFITIDERTGKVLLDKVATNLRNEV